MQTLFIRNSLALTACSAQTWSLIFTPRHSGVKGTDDSASGYSCPMDLRVVGGIFHFGWLVLLVEPIVFFLSTFETATDRNA